MKEKVRSKCPVLKHLLKLKGVAVIFGPSLLRKEKCGVVRIKLRKDELFMKKFGVGEK